MKSFFTVVLDKIQSFLQPKAQRYPIGITQDVLDTIRASAQSTYPNEFLCFLIGEHAEKCPQIEETEGYIINDFYLIPGTTSNTHSAQVDTNNIPVNSQILGSAHSHPNGTLQPSQEDLNMFRKYSVNIIFGHPYERGDWIAYNREGTAIDFPVRNC